MNETLIIIFRQDQLLCWRLTGDDISEVLVFSFEPQPLFAWLKNFPGAGVHVLLDLMEEEIYVENAPMLFSWEQSTFAERQMRKRFPKTTLCQFRFSDQKALPWESRAGLLLVSGFNDDASLIKLLSWLDTAQIAVLSIHSIGLLFPNLFKEIWFSHHKQVALWQEKPHFLLSRTDKDSFRQSLIVNGSLRTTRQIQLREETTEAQMLQLLQEIKLLDKFVHTQKMIDYEQTPDIYYLGFTQEDSELAWQTFQNTPYAGAGRGAFISATSVVSVTANDAKASINDMLQLLAFNRRKSASDYFSQSVVDAKNYRNIKVGLWATLVCVMIAFFAYAAYFMAKSVSFDETMHSLQNQHTKYQELAVKLQSQLRLTVPIEQLKNSVELVNHIQDSALQQQSLPYLVDFSEVLSSYPRIHLLELAWSPSSDNGQKVGKMDNTHFSVAVTAAIVSDAHTRLRDVLNVMDAFLAELDHKPTVAQVTLVQKPVDLDSSRPLTIKADDDFDTVQEYPFKLIISFKPPL